LSCDYTNGLGGGCDALYGRLANGYCYAFNEDGKDLSDFFVDCYDLKQSFIDMCYELANDKTKKLMIENFSNHLPSCVKQNIFDCLVNDCIIDDNDITRYIK